MPVLWSSTILPSSSPLPAILNEVDRFGTTATTDERHHRHFGRPARQKAMAEGVQLVAVHIGDRAGRAQVEIAADQAHRDHRARLQRGGSAPTSGSAADCPPIPCIGLRPRRSRLGPEQVEGALGKAGHRYRGGDRHQLRVAADRHAARAAAAIRVVVPGCCERRPSDPGAQARLPSKRASGAGLRRAGCSAGHRARSPSPRRHGRSPFRAGRARPRCIGLRVNHLLDRAESRRSARSKMETRTPPRRPACRRCTRGCRSCRQSRLSFRARRR